MNARNGQLRCAQCDAVFNHVSSLTRHGHIHSGAFRCARNGCEKSFCERKQLSKHLNRHSSTNIKVRIVPFNIRTKVEVKEEQNDDFIGGSSQQSVQHWKRVKKEEEEDEIKVKIEVKDEHDQNGNKDRDNGHTVGNCKKEEEDESYCGCDDCLGETEPNVNVHGQLENLGISDYNNQQQNVLVNNATDNDTQQEWDEHEIEEEIDDGHDNDDETDEDEEDDENEDGLFTSGQIDEDEMDVNGGGEDAEVEEESEPNEDEGDVIEHASKRCKRMVIQQKEMETTNETGEESIATECTTNPTQPNLAQPNRHLQCPKCPKSFDRNFNLQRHLRVHTGERPFPCRHCDKRFKERSNLTKHLRFHQNIKRFRCHECDKQFTQRAHLLTHLLIHSDERPFPYRHCDKSFRERGHLTRHQLIHQNIKRFRCNECDKQFTLKQTLDSHLRIHSGGRPFECRHCEKSFTQLSTRHRHEQAIHLHVKPNRYKQCGHTATQRSVIIRHIRVNHFGLPQTTKQQQTLNIIDDRDTRELIEKV